MNLVEKLEKYGLDPSDLATLVHASEEAVRELSPKMKRRLFFPAMHYWGLAPRARKSVWREYFSGKPHPLHVIIFVRKIAPIDVAKATGLSERKIDQMLLSSELKPGQKKRIGKYVANKFPELLHLF